MASFTEIIGKDGKKAYRAQMFLGIDPLTGKKVRTTRTVRTKKEGKILESQLKLAFENGNLEAKNKQYTYQEIYDMWMLEYEKTVKDSTLLKTERLFENHILPVLSDKLIQKVSPLDMQANLDAWSKKVSKAAELANYAGMVFDYAQRMELITNNPARLIKKPPKRSKHTVDEDFNYYNTDTLKLFLKALDGASPKVKAYFRLLAFTGMRKAEAQALRWMDVTSKTINIDKAVVRNKKGLYIGPPKNNASIRRISVDKETYAILKDWKKAQSPAQDSYLIFSEDGKTLQSMDTSRGWLLKIQDKMDVEAQKKLKRITIHGFRHTHASLLFESGATIKQVQDRLGHSDAQTTMNIYTHVSQSSRDNTAEKFANYIKGIN
ncbi:tyrosine-type recombinase/integrase [Enterococcus nangangensis]|uniref:tyrosine-type recombinase/integrase n=1 Tax=Enterococcus nangangensis TaxID=2559926 RepID=UPI0014855206|nr:site-specific integrase [Enterococcus nangangensis]